MYFNKSKNSLQRPETISASDLPLSKSEAEAIIEIAKIWPGGMGEVLVPSSSKRGYSRDKDFNVFNTCGYLYKEGTILCPVMEIKTQRNWTNFAQHLSAFRSIRNAYASTLNLELREARLLYNSHLKSNPTEIVLVLEQYIKNNF